MSVVAGREAGSPLEDSADVVIVGSGASGAVLAKELIADGRSVILVEEGPWYTPEQKQRFTVPEAMQKLFRAGGATVATGVGDTPVISNPLGWGAGGSSVLTGGVCFRTPEPILSTWETGVGLEGFGPDGMAPYFDEIERDLHVAPTPEAALSDALKRFRGGAEALGLEMLNTPRNMSGCRGASRCNFVCPVDAKHSVDRNYLPAALEGGMTLVCDGLAQKLIVEGGQVVGVKGRLLAAGGKPKGRFAVRGKVVILAMGAVHTAQFLLRNDLGTGSGLVGRGMTIHPAMRSYGVFPDEVRAGRGAMQGIYSPTLGDEGIHLIAIMTPPGVMGSNVPGFGPKAREYMEKRKHIMAFGAMIHDRDEGRVVDIPGREPLMYYTLGPEAKALFVRAAQVMCDIYFEAGATEVLMTMPPFERIRSREEAARISVDNVQWKHLECGSYHPLGTVRMGTDPAASVVDPAGRIWGHDNVYVVDGSIVPTHLGVNSQETIMAVALKLARRMRDEGDRLFA
ncbi:MAG: GMC family oxidoreductase [Myxococcota bacterium]|jgi:choline dehydrogenase-like flavoprotein|nr:GMC family oxidoreductase [Myxococcota bacterium]